jgi:hypothetical protein
MTIGFGEEHYRQAAACLSPSIYQQRIQLGCARSALANNAPVIEGPSFSNYLTVCGL